LFYSENKIAVVGSGGAAAECIKAIRGSGFSGEIHVFTDSKWPIYNPMLTTHYAAGIINYDQLFPYGNSTKFYQDYQIEVHSDSPVVFLDAEKRIVANQIGFELKYAQCLIASGASPILPSIEGIRSDKVHTLRTVSDAIRLKEALDQKPRKAIVVGASMVGVKMVELFYRAGMQVCLADLADHLFPLTASPECAIIMEDRLKQKGIRLLFGAGIKRVEDRSGVIRAHFTYKESEEADLLALCIGMSPNINYINRQQVKVQQGVLVDDHLCTNIPGLYAAGDVSQGINLLTSTHQIVALWANACCQGRTAGRNMVGINEVFPGSIHHNITRFLDMNFISIGDIFNYDRVEHKFDGIRSLQLFWQGELLTGVNILGDYMETGVIKNALLKGLRQSKGLRQNIRYSGEPLPVLQNFLIKKILAEVGK
jgi:NADPH-dependent 2,4-dienoyl-CoA reductase/sulfur reductase-like enzyme